MQTNLADFIRDTADGAEADAILRKCVHCGFCTATCPTYQLLGDELDGPRGRIYLIKQMVEGAQVTRSTQTHLDRCLTCRNCESTCPSGVQYGRLVEIGRKITEEKVARPFAQRMLRRLLASFVPNSALFTPAMRLGQHVRAFLPKKLRDKVPARQRPLEWPDAKHARKMLMLAGCVQPSMMPNVNIATARVLDALGVETIVAPEAGCCGAIRLHLGYNDEALDDIRANIDAWWPHVEQGVEAIVMNASGCGATVKEYGHLLRNDPAYAGKAERIATMTRDICRDPARVRGGARHGDAPPRRTHRGVPPALHVAAWPAVTRQGRAHPRGARDRSAPAGRQPSVLRLGRHLFADSADALICTARSEASKSCRLRSRR